MSLLLLVGAALLGAAHAAEPSVAPEASKKHAHTVMLGTEAVTRIVEEYDGLPPNFPMTIPAGAEAKATRAVPPDADWELYVVEGKAAESAADFHAHLAASATAKGFTVTSGDDEVLLEFERRRKDGFVAIVPQILIPPRGDTDVATMDHHDGIFCGAGTIVGDESHTKFSILCVIPPVKPADDPPSLVVE